MVCASILPWPTSKHWRGHAATCRDDDGAAGRGPRTRRIQALSKEGPPRERTRKDPCPCIVLVKHRHTSQLDLIFLPKNPWIDDALLVLQQNDAPQVVSNHENSIEEGDVPTFTDDSLTGYSDSFFAKDNIIFLLCSPKFLLQKELYPYSSLFLSLSLSLLFRKARS
jgi:hypothetical protein